MRDPYAVLGVDPFFAKAKEISRAFHKLAKKLHPDKPGGSETAFKELSGAYEILGDPDRRKLWDEFGEASTRIGFNPDAARARTTQPSWVTEPWMPPDPAPTPHSPQQRQEYVQRFSTEPPPKPDRTDHGSFGSFGSFGAKGPGDL